MSTGIKDHSLGLRVSEDDSRLLEDAIRKGWGSSKGEVVRRLIDINLRRDTPENQVKLQIIKIFEANPMEFVVYMYHRLLYLTKTEKELSQDAGLMAFGIKELVTTLFGVETKDVYEIRDDILKTISEPLAPANIPETKPPEGEQKQTNNANVAVQTLINTLRKNIEREKNWQKTIDGIICIINVAEVWEVQNPLTQRLVEATYLEDSTERREKLTEAFQDLTLIIPEILPDEAFRKAVLDGVLAHFA